MVYLVYLLTLFIFALLSFFTIQFSVLTNKSIRENQAKNVSATSGMTLLYFAGLLLFGYFFFQNLFAAIEWSINNNFFATFSVSHTVFIGYLLGGIVYFLLKKRRKV